MGPGPLPPSKNSHERVHSAKQLKSAWIQTRKIKSKWKAEKRREGIQSPEKLPGAPGPDVPVSNIPGILGQGSDHQPPLTDVHPGTNAPPSRSGGHPVKTPNSQAIRESIRTTKTGPAVGSSQRKDHRSGRHDHQGRPNGHQGKKPNMRNRMNALLEKIQREID